MPRVSAHFDDDAVSIKRRGLLIDAGGHEPYIRERISRMLSQKGSRDSFFLARPRPPLVRIKLEF